MDLFWKPLSWLGTLRPSSATDAFDLPLWETFFTSTKVWRFLFTEPGWQLEPGLRPQHHPTKVTSTLESSLQITIISSTPVPNCHAQSEVSLLARVLALRCQLLLQYRMIEGAHKLPIEDVQLPCTP